MSSWSSSAAPSPYPNMARDAVNKQDLHIDDDQSTTVPSDVLDGTASSLTAWDTGNLEDLATSGVLSSAEIRAARLQRLQLASGASKAAARSVVPRPKVAGAPSAFAKAAFAKGLPHTGAPSAPGVAAVAKGQQTKPSTPAASPVTPPKSASGVQASSQSQPKTSLPASTLKSHLDKASYEGLHELGLWEHMPSRNPVVTRNTKLGADWNISFNQYQHTLGGEPDTKPAPRPPQVDELHRQLDIKSRDALKDMGLWEHMPVRNPVVTQTAMGAHWHRPFGEYEHTLGGVPDSKPVVRPQHADNIHRQLDKASRENVKQMGLWEFAPAKNPVVTSSKLGASWNVNFQ